MKRLAALLTVVVLAGCPATSPGTTTGTSTDSNTATDSSTKTDDSSSTDASSGDKVTFATANAIIQQRCVTCHTTSSPAGGTALETPEQIKAKAQRVSVRVAAKTMPQANKTGMTDEERKTIADWFAAGAPTE